MPEIGRLVAIIDGDLSGLERALGNAQKVLNRAGNQMSSAGRALSIGVTAPIVAIGGLAIKASMDFETAFAGVNKTVDASAQELAVLRQGIIDMSKEMPATAVEIAGVAEAAGQLGVKKEDILSFTKTMVMLGETTNLTATEAATSMAKFANVMQAPAKDIERLSSVLVDLGNNGASTERDILEMAQRIAAAGKTVGMSATDVLSLANALSSVGINAEAGGTAVSRVLIDMAQAAANLKPTEEQLKAIGDAQRDVRDSGLALGAANRGVRDAFESLADAQRGVRDSAQGVADAQRGVRDANEAVTAAHRSVRDAAEGVAQAHRNTRNATETLVDAQRALVRVYRDARQASLDARRETLSVAEAYQGLREVQAGLGQHALDLKEAQLGVAEAHKRVKDAAKGSSLEQQQASVGLERAQARLNQVMSQGGRETLDLRNAQLRYEEAQLRVGKAAETWRDQETGAVRAVRNAREGLADSQKAERNAKEGLNDAIRHERDAREAVAGALRAEVGAREAYAGSLRAVRNAQEGVTDAQNAAVVAQEKYADSQAKLNLLMDQVFGKLGNYAKLAGMLPEQFAELVKSNPSEAFTRVVEGMQRIQKEGGNLFKILDDLGLSDVRVRDTMLSLANGGDILRNSLNLGRKAYEDNSALTVEYGKKVQTTAAQMEIMRNRVNATMIALGDELTPTLLEASQNMMPMLDAFAKLTALFAAAPGPVQTAVIAFFGFSAALGPSLFGLGQMFKMTKDVIGAAPALKGAFMLMRTGVMALSSSLLTPPMGIIIALAALAVVLYIFRDDIYKALKPALDWATKAFGKVSEAVTDGLGGALNYVKSHWREIATLISGPFAPVVALATDAFGIRSALEGALSAMVGTVSGLATSIASSIASAFTGAVGVVGEAVMAIMGAIESNFNAETMGKVFGFWLTLPIRIFRQGLLPLHNIVYEFFGVKLPGIVGSVIPLVMGALSRLNVAVGTFFTSTLPKVIAGAASNGFNAAKTVGLAYINGQIAGMKAAIGLITAAPRWILDAFVTAWNGLTSAIELIGNKIMNGIIAGIEAAPNLIANAAVFVWNAFVGWFNTHLQNFKNLGEAIVKGVIAGIKGLAKWAEQQVSDFFGGLWDSAKNAVKPGSPSKVYTVLGESIGQGIAAGIGNTAGEATNAMASMMALLGSAAQMPMVQMPPVRMPSYRQSSFGLQPTEGTGGGGGYESDQIASARTAWGRAMDNMNLAAKGEAKLAISINGPLNILNQGRRLDVNGALGDLAFGVQGQLNRRGIYA